MKIFSQYPRTSAQLYMTQVTEATSKKKLCKNICDPKDIATKSGETHVYVYADRLEISVPRAKNTQFPYRGLPWGLPSHVIYFWKALVEPMYMLRPIWHVRLRLTAFEIFTVKICHFGGLLGVTQGETVSGTDVYRHARFHADRCHRRRVNL